MILTINENQIDFKLEEEKTLKEVIHGIDSWLKSSNLIIEKLYINDKDFSDADLEVPLDGIENINIQTVSINEIKVNNLSLIINFLTNLKDIYSNWSKDKSDLVKKEIDVVYYQISELLSPDNIKVEVSFSNGLKEKLDKSSFFSSKLTEGYSDVIPYIDSLILLLNERINEYTSPYEELTTALDTMDSFNEQLEQVSIYLQTGKENEASIIMTRFISLFQKVIRLLDINKVDDKVINKNELEEFICELNDILKELLEGYETQDIVLIGDILEYEISPKIDHLKKIIS